ncbi:MAG: ECF-type sigma factor [Bryobacteraceae bacterium]
MNQADGDGEVTALLRAWSGGDRSVEDRLFQLVLPDLRRIAGALMSKERADHSLQPTALLNETYFRLVGARQNDWANRRHFFAVAARAMRRLLIDHARARPHGVKIPIDGMEELLKGRESQMELALSIDGLLDELSQTQQDWCSVVELKFFWGFTDEETAAALDISVRTTQRHFGDARRWLFEKLEQGKCKANSKTTNS